MIPEDKIITSVEAENGAYVDGTKFEEHFRKTKEAGVALKEAYGDKAYFRKPILELLENENMKVYIPPSESVIRIDESQFAYNKDSDQWICRNGCYSIGKKVGKNYINYKFDRKDCEDCPYRPECIKEKTRKSKALKVGRNAPEYYKYLVLSKKDDFLEGYKKRACHENKNGEMKRFHGLAKAKGYSLLSMRKQARLTAIAVNLKRIAKLVSSAFQYILHILRIRKSIAILKWCCC